MIVIRQEDFIASVAGALQYISYYHPVDYITSLAKAYEREQSPAARDAIAQILDQQPHVRRRPPPHLPGHGHRKRICEAGHGCAVRRAFRRQPFGWSAGDGRRRRAPRLSRSRQQAARFCPGRSRGRAQKHQRQYAGLRHGRTRARQHGRSHGRRQGRRIGSEIEVHHAESRRTRSSSGCSRPCPRWARAGARRAFWASASAARQRRRC